MLRLLCALHTNGETQDLDDLSILRGTTVNRTQGSHNDVHISHFFLRVFDPIHTGRPVLVDRDLSETVDSQDEAIRLTRPQS